MGTSGCPMWTTSSPLPPQIGCGLTSCPPLVNPPGSQTSWWPAPWTTWTECYGVRFEWFQPSGYGPSCTTPSKTRTPPSPSRSRAYPAESSPLRSSYANCKPRPLRHLPVRPRCSSPRRRRRRLLSFLLPRSLALPLRRPSPRQLRRPLPRRRPSLHFQLRLHLQQNKTNPPVSTSGIGLLARQRRPGRPRAASAAHASTRTSPIER